jgi:hypothetical protein
MLSRISVLFDKAETFDDGLPQGARVDVVFHGLNEPQGERLTLFVGAGEDRTKALNLVV